MIKKVNLQQTLDRYLAFCERRLNGGILAAIHPGPPPGAAPRADVGETKVRGCLVLDDLPGCIRRARALDVSDWLCDVIPAVYPTMPFGESVWSGLLGAEITFSGNNVHTWSYCPTHVIDSAAKFAFPPISPDNDWFCKMLDVTACFVRELKSGFDFQPFIFMDCLNLLVELRGAERAYLDLYDNPDFVARFMEWSVVENMRVFDAQADLMRGAVRAAYGGHPALRYAACQVPNISIDAYGLCRPEIYESFGLAHHRRIAKRYGGAQLHIHGNGRHLCRLAARIENLTWCSFSEDVGFQNPCDVIEDIQESMRPVPIRIAIPKEMFLARLNRRSLPGDVFYDVTGVASVAEANAIMSRVFTYRPSG